MTDAVELAKARIEEALLKEYRWHDHDYWSSDEDIRDMEERGQTAWPHLSHVADVAAYAAGLDEAHALIKELGRHLVELCNHPVNYANRYIWTDGRPLPCCYDARDKYEEWLAQHG